MWIQDWSGKIVTGFGTRVFWNWRWNETWYPRLDTVIQDLKQEGVMVTAYITAHLNVDGDVFQEHAEEDAWLKDENGNQLRQDFGEFEVNSSYKLLGYPAFEKGYRYSVNHRDISKRFFIR